MRVMVKTASALRVSLLAGHKLVMVVRNRSVMKTGDLIYV